jgi:hypothetical protein
MKLSARFSQIFALLVITLTLLTVSVFASSKSTANYGDPQGTSAHPHLSAANTIKGAAIAYTQTGALKPQNIYSFTEDGHALRSNRFNMPDPLRYAITTSPGFGNVIRKARIKRKGNFQG